jgi:hypothetical protein
MRRQRLGEVHAPNFRADMKGERCYFDDLIRLGTDILLRGRRHLPASSVRYFD